MLHPESEYNSFFFGYRTCAICLDKEYDYENLVNFKVKRPIKTDDGELLIPAGRHMVHEKCRDEWMKNELR